MPLVIVTGYPSSGKTKFSNYLANYLRNKGSNVIVINEESLHINKVAGYQSSFVEKETRSAIKSAVNQSLTTETFVIVDSLNYIKGYRYELYCIARSVRTPHCVCWVQSDTNDSQVWNRKRMEETGDGYPDNIIEELKMRFEPPNEKNRWDSPLYRVRNNNEEREDGPRDDRTKGGEGESSMAAVEDSVGLDSTTAQAPRPRMMTSSWKSKKDKTQEVEGVQPVVDDNHQAKEAAFPATVFTSSALSISGSAIVVENETDGVPFERACERVNEYFASAAAPVPNQSTVPIKHAQADLLYEIDKVTQEIVKVIADHQKDSLEGTPIIFRSYDRTITLHRRVGLAELQRHRKQFVKMHGQLSATSVQSIGSSFIEYLAAQL